VVIYHLLDYGLAAAGIKTAGLVFGGQPQLLPYTALQQKNMMVLLGLQVEVY
jgi:hypothetical protein